MSSKTSPFHQCLAWKLLLFVLLVGEAIDAAGFFLSLLFSNTDVLPSTKLLAVKFSPLDSNTCVAAKGLCFGWIPVISANWSTTDSFSYVRGVVVVTRCSYNKVWPI